MRTTECGLVLDDNGYISQPDFVVTALEAGRGETWRCDGIEAFGICGSDEYYDYWAEADVEFTVTCPSNRITYSGVLAWRQYLNSCKDTFKDDIKDLYGDASCPAGKTTITAIPLDDTASFNPETGYFKFNGYSGKVQIPLTLLLNGGTSVDKGHDEYLGYNERAMPLPALGEGTRKLARPILFIHGIGDEHTVWGVNDSLDENYETSVDHDTWKQGLVSAYDQGSAPDVIAYTYGLDVSTEGDDPSQWGINENGLFFFNGNDKDSSWTTQWIDPWWTADDGGEGQSQQLYNRMSEILTDWYGDSWTTDSSMKIDLVTHSQGGLVVRDLFNNAASAGGTALSNPANHVRKVVTLDAPHLGTALSTDPDLMPSKFSSVGDLAAGLDTVAYANHTLVKVTIDDDILESITEFSLKMAGIRNSNLDAISDVLGLSGGLASLNGFLTGWNDLSFTLKGGYLGNYKGTFKIDLLLTTLSYSTTINSP
ncbi:MAG TPA: hypothetical protein VLM37_04225, partial [Fibrobacteraceae bacterium]|nr:hypothetical protein [Fibrobacteraceae bacterium]